MDNGEIEKNIAIGKAIEHAGDLWAKSAYAILKFNLRNKPSGFEFICEDIIKSAEDWDLFEPPTKRAWGAVILRAKREGLIKSAGVVEANNPNVHKNMVTLWRKV